MRTDEIVPFLVYFIERIFSIIFLCRIVSEQIAIEDTSGAGTQNTASLVAGTVQRCRGSTINFDHRPIRSEHQSPKQSSLKRNPRGSIICRRESGFQARDSTCKDDFCAREKRIPEIQRKGSWE